MYEYGNHCVLMWVCISMAITDRFFQEGIHMTSIDWCVVLSHQPSDHNYGWSQPSQITFINAIAPCQNATHHHPRPDEICDINGTSHGNHQLSVELRDLAKEVVLASLVLCLLTQGVLIKLCFHGQSSLLHIIAFSCRWCGTSPKWVITTFLRLFRVSFLCLINSLFKQLVKST